jgi:hypothetical protein
MAANQIKSNKDGFTLYSDNNEDEAMVKSSIRFMNAGESLAEILESLTSSMYILYISTDWKMKPSKRRGGANSNNPV